MNPKNLSQPIFEEWKRVAESGPQERLPKEEQTRCIIYSALRSEFRTVSAERGYGSIDEGSRPECDLWAHSEGQPQVFIEIKHAWSAPRLNNKPSAQMASWMTDLAKMEGLPPDTDRFFILVGFLDADPLLVTMPESRSVLSGIRGLHPSKLVFQDSSTFRWRKEGITHIAMWAWHWPAGTALDSLAKV